MAMSIVQRHPRLAIYGRIVVDVFKRVAIEVLLGRLRSSEMGERVDERSIEERYPERSRVAGRGGGTKCDAQY